MTFWRDPSLAAGYCVINDPNSIVRENNQIKWRPTGKFEERKPKCINLIIHMC